MTVVFNSSKILICKQNLSKNTKEAAPLTQPPGFNYICQSIIALCIDCSAQSILLDKLAAGRHILTHQH